MPGILDFEIMQYFEPKIDALIKKATDTNLITQDQQNQLSEEINFPYHVNLADWDPFINSLKILNKKIKDLDDQLDQTGATELYCPKIIDKLVTTIGIIRKSLMYLQSSSMPEREQKRKELEIVLTDLSLLIDRALTHLNQPTPNSKTDTSPLLQENIAYGTFNPRVNIELETETKSCCGCLPFFKHKNDANKVENAKTYTN